MMQIDPEKWTGVPGDRPPSKFSGWNAGLAPLFAFAAIAAGLAVYDLCNDTNYAGGLLRGTANVVTGNLSGDDSYTKPAASAPTPRQ